MNAEASTPVKWIEMNPSISASSFNFVIRVKLSANSTKVMPILPSSPLIKLFTTKSAFVAPW